MSEILIAPADAPPVVLLHGLGRTRISMWLLAWWLDRAGFRTRTIGYPSTRLTMAQSEALLREKLAGMGPVDLIGHSLGGVLSARLLRSPEGLGIRRVVQLGAPNLGSPLATRLSGIWPVRRLCGPVVADLHAHDRMPSRHPDLAAIAGTAGSPKMPLTKPHDGAVTVRSAWAGAGCRAAVPVLHTLLPHSRGAARLAAEFLSTGCIEQGRP